MMRLLAKASPRPSHTETRNYTGARHELLSETDRDEGQRDALACRAKTV